MNTKKILIAVLLACAFAPAAALAEAFEEAGEPVRRIVTRGGDNIDVQLGHPLDLGRNTTVLHLGPGKLVKNAPYSAEMVSERTQTLGDGNQIVNKSSSLSYRDSAGRTRVEARGPDGEVRSVAIDDPVEGVRYVLHPRDKRATKIVAPNLALRAAREQARAAASEARVAATAARGAQGEARAAAQAARVHVETLRRDGKLVEGGERIIIKQVERRGAAAGNQQDVNIRIAQVAPLAAAQIGPALERALDERKWASQAETRDLGTREFNGVKASGSQRSYEIPAGEIGNRHPIVVSTETWTSPELQVVVYQKRSDPRAGDTVLRLEDLKRDEPAAALFTVPSDYTVREPLAAARAVKKTP